MEFFAPEDLLRYFSRNPGALMGDISRGEMERDFFCHRLHEGLIEYRPPRLRKWPVGPKEADALRDLQRHYHPTQEHLAPFVEPYVRRLRTLLPSAIREFEEGNRYAVYRLARAMPGLLKTSRLVARDPDLLRVPENYLRQIEKFQGMFVRLLVERRLRTGRPRKHPSRMADVYLVLQKLIDAGIPKKCVQAFLPKIGTPTIDARYFCDLASDTHKVEKKLRAHRKKKFDGTAAIADELRRAGVPPSRPVLIFAMADWIWIQYWFRKRVIQHAAAIRDEMEKLKTRLSTHALTQDKHYRALLREQKKCKGIPPLPSANDLMANAKRIWPGLPTKATGRGFRFQSVKNFADALLELFGRVLDTCGGNDILIRSRFQEKVLQYGFAEKVFAHP
jgi:hypothetical protein